MKIAVTGGREHTPTLAEMNRYEFLWNMLGGKAQVNGMCKHKTALPGNVPVGVDAHLLVWAREAGVPVLPFYAEWNRFGRGAGMIRNKKMVDTCDVLIAFPGGKGTASAIAAARELGRPVYFATPAPEGEPGAAP
jgi:hypothetical protein